MSLSFTAQLVLSVLFVQADKKKSGVKLNLQPHFFSSVSSPARQLPSLYVCGGLFLLLYSSTSPGASNATSGCLKWRVQGFFFFFLANNTSALLSDYSPSVTWKAALSLDLTSSRKDGVCVHSHERDKLANVTQIVEKHTRGHI